MKHCFNLRDEVSVQAMNLPETRKDNVYIT